MTLDNVRSFLVRSRNTKDIIAREEYETAIALALESVDQLELENRELEDENDRLESADIDARQWIGNLKVDKNAQAQTIKAAHIRTAELAIRYTDCQRELEEQIKRENEADCY